MRGRRAALAFATAVNLAVLYSPRTASTGAGVPHLDKAVHLLVFAAVAWTGRRAGVSWRLLAALLVANAVVSEVVQDRLMEQRSGDLGDVLADLAGIAVGLGLPAGPGVPLGRGDREADWAP